MNQSTRWRAFLWAGGLLLLGAIAASAPALAAGWDAPDDLADVTGSGGNYQLFSTKVLPLGNGSALAVWGETNATGWYFVYASFYSPQSGWSPAQNISSNASWYIDPVPAKDAAGNIFVVFEAWSGRNIFAVRYVPGVGWSNQAQISVTPTNIFAIAYNPSLSVDGNGNAYVVWTEWERDTGNRSVWANRYANGVGWGAAEALQPYEPTTGSMPATAGVDGAGNAMAFWLASNNSTYVVRWSRYTSASGWSPRQDFPGLVSLPSLAVFANGTAVMSWGNESGAFWRWYIPGAGWQAPELCVNAYMAGGALFSFSGSGTATVTWSYYNSSLYDIWSSVFVPGVGWSTPERHTDRSHGAPNAIGVDASGRAVRVWAEANGSYGDMVAARFLPGRGWQTTRAIEPANGSSSWIGLAVGGDGFAFATWGSAINGSWHGMVGRFVPDATPPVVSAGADIDLTAGSTAQFSGNATDDDAAFPAGATITWTFNYSGAPVVRSGYGFQFDFNILGTYLVTLRVTDAEGNAGTDTLIVRVGSPDLIAPVVDAGADITVLVGDNQTFSGAASDNDPSFASTGITWWTFEVNGTPYNLSGSSFVFNFTAPGNVTLTFWARDGWLNTANDTVVLLVVMPDTSPPTINAGPDAMTLVGQRIDFRATASSADPRFPFGSTFSWHFAYNGSNTTLTGNPAPYAFATHGVFVVEVRLADRWGNIVNDTLQVIVLAPDGVPPQVNPIPDTTVEAGRPFEVAAVATDNSAEFGLVANYSWAFRYSGRDYEVFGNPLRYTFLLDADVVVSLVVRDGLLNPSAPETFTLHVVVIDVTPPIVRASADRYEVAAGTTVTLFGFAEDRNRSIVVDSVFLWTLQGANATNATGQTVQVHFDQAGNYTLTLRVKDLAGNEGSATVNITVTAVPVNPPGILPGPGAVALVGALAAAATLLSWRGARRPRE